MTAEPNLKFPQEFIWGVAATAPQIEGAAFEDGKGESAWDRFSRIPGKIRGDDRLDVACDHYHRFQSDFALMRELGVKHYSLSLAWPRIVPHGKGPVNQAGIDFYDRLFDAMEENGITPWVTLFHWDTPQALEDLGGWRSRLTVDAFAGYAEIAVKAFAGRVKHWITVNEIRCFTQHSYSGGLDKAPGIFEQPQVVNQTVHHALVAHGYAMRAIREHGGPGATAGLTDNVEVAIPIVETDEHIAAARTETLSRNLHILDPIFRGCYSQTYLRRCGKDRARVEKGDCDVIGLPMDYLGLNLYTGVFVRAVTGGHAEVLPFPESYPQSQAANWLYLVPQALYWAPRFCQELYKPDRIYIMENGIGSFERPDGRGEILDLDRREYLRSCLLELQRATANGVAVRGYFLWSFLDNFEWTDGYSTRFGIVHNDFETQRRTPKLSADWYSSVMRHNRVL